MIINILLYAGLIIIIWLIAVVVLLLVFYGKALKKLWQEPMLRQPVVIFDSDDWGVGSKKQLTALTELLQLFLQYRDKNQNHPVLALGLVLAEPDVKKITDNQHYDSRHLSDNRYQDLVQLIKAGHQQSVFALYLHGMEHFWPASLMQNAHKQAVKYWFLESKKAEGDGKNDNVLHHTEQLPSYLQSRWCDTSVLPSVELAQDEIKQAVSAEITLFQQLFKQRPKVVVPPTFVWTDEVIKNYVSQYVDIFITPGQQFTGRDQAGALISNGRTFYNGQCDDNGACYLVRDIYFEPELGHKAKRVIKEITQHTRCGRPSLIEMHRFNFMHNKDMSINELKHLLDQIKHKLPDTLYFSAEQLMDNYQSKNRYYLYTKTADRVKIWLARLQWFLKDKRLAKYSGFNKLLSLR